MKKVFVILFASAAFSMGSCNSGTHDDSEMMDSAQAKEMVNEAMDSVKAATDAAMDTAKEKIQDAADSAKVK